MIYLRFVNWLAAQGHDVLVFDYRGIGLSRHGHLKHNLLRTFPAAQKQSMRIKPASHGLKDIGHIDWFRASHQALWPMMASSLRGQG